MTRTNLAPLPHHDDRWLLDAVHRLDREFGGALGRADIAQVVSWSRADLDGPHPAAMPELVERLARERLLQRVALTAVAGELSAGQARRRRPAAASSARR
jgi:hypothetical protein